MLRSTQTREESSLTADNTGQVTVNNELPGNQNNNNAALARDQSKKSEEPTITRSPAPPRPK